MPKNNDDEPPGDFSDPESQRVLTAAARALAGILGRQAAREHFEQLRTEIQRGYDDVDAGRVTKLESDEQIDAFFKSLGDDEEPR
jgi:hypothetical protein